MIRELVLDTETTGLNYEDGHRLVEIGIVELNNHIQTGNYFHYYLNPERDSDKRAEEIHGLSNSFLRKYKKFEDKAEEFHSFIKDSKLIIHNAQFDLSMLNNAFKRLGMKQISKDQAICTLEMAKKKFPGSKNNLNALCRRFNISLESREKHGALTDCKLLLEVYIELLGGKQEKLSLMVKQNEDSNLENFTMLNYEKNLVEVSHEEEIQHQLMLKKISNPIWSK